MKVSLKTSFGAKCGVEDLALLSMYPSPIKVLYLGPVTPDSQYHPEVGEPATHLGVGNFVELLNFAICQGNKDLSII